MQKHGCLSLTFLFLISNEIGAERCVALVRGLVGCPILQKVKLGSNSIDALPDELGELRTLGALDISENMIEEIQPALYGLILQLVYLNTVLNSLEDISPEFTELKLDDLKDCLQEMESKGAREPSTV